MAKRIAKPIEDDEDELDEEMEADEEYEDEDYEERSRVVPFLLLTVALLAFVGLGWYAYQAGSAPDSEELMLVEADQTPIKEKPLDAGGMQFPHQDKSVFETIAGGNSAAGDAQIVNSAEEPVAMQAAPAEPAAAPVAQVPVDEAATAAPAPASEPAATATAAEIKEMPVAKLKEIEPAAAAPPAVQPAVQPAKPKAVASASGKQTIQLGAFKTQAEAEAAWRKVSGNAALSGKSPNIIRADLGEKGVFYRLRVSGVNAKATCASLAGKSPCMAVN